MDPASLAIGVSGFAFQFYIAAQAGYKIITAAKATSEAASRLQVLMGFEQIRFESWADVVGLADAETEFEDQLKNDRAMYHLTMQALCHVCNTVTRFNELTDRYGIRRSERARLTGLLHHRSSVEGEDDVEDADIGNQTIAIPNLFIDDSRAAFEEILHAYQKRISFMHKFSWAVKDKAKYEELVTQMREMNNGLHSSLPRTMQSLLRRVLVSGQPNNLSSLREIESTMAGPGQNTDYYRAAIIKRTALEQTRLEMNFLEDRKPVISESHVKSLEIDPASILAAEENIPRILRVQAGKVQTKYFIEYKFLGASDPVTGDKTVLFKRLLNLIDLLCITPKPSQYRILDCKGFVRHDLNSEERYGLVFTLPSRLAAHPQLRFSTLQELLRSERDNTPPLHFPLEHRFQLAARLASAIAYMHFAGWLHRSLSSDSVTCFYAENRPHITEPFLTGFAYSRPDNPREVSEFDPSTTANLYRHPDAQLPQPACKFRRSFDLYSLGVVLVEIGFWKRIRVFWRPDFDAVGFRQHLLGNVVPLLAFYMGEKYANAVRACLDVESLEVGGDEERRLSAAFSRVVVQQLQQCEM